MGLISTRQYDRTLRFVNDVARIIRTSPPVQIIRRLHAQSFAEVQQAQAGIERHYQFQQRHPSQPTPPRQSHPRSDASPANGMPRPLPPSNRRPMGQLLPPSPRTQPRSQPPTPSPDPQPWQRDYRDR
ncbi:MAG: hypothetical protein AB4040_13215 [Synechococcus sp.]